MQNKLEKSLLHKKIESLLPPRPPKKSYTHKLEILFPSRPLPPLQQDEIVKTEDRREDMYKQNAETLFCRFQFLFICVALHASIINRGDVLKLHVFCLFVLFVLFFLFFFFIAPLL